MVRYTHYNSILIRFASDRICYRYESCMDTDRLNELKAKPLKYVPILF